MLFVMKIYIKYCIYVKIFVILRREMIFYAKAI